jgi:hypothetical protein
LGVSLSANGALCGDYQFLTVRRRRCITCKRAHAWSAKHGHVHLRPYLNIVASHGIPLPPDNILHMDPENANEFMMWLDRHEVTHEFLCAQSGVSGGVNLAYFDPGSGSRSN